MDDVRAVMDAAGSERAALFGVSEGGPMSLLFAATYPQRVRALLLYGCYARSSTLLDDDVFNERVALIDRAWGTGQYILSLFIPSGTSDEGMRSLMAHFERQSASPSAVIAIVRMNREIDARHILPAIHVPTLVMHRNGDLAQPIQNGRYLAENIPGAKFLELPGENHIPWFESEITDRIAGEVEEFLTGSRNDADVDRVLASTRRSAPPRSAIASGAPSLTAMTTPCGSSLPVFAGGRSRAWVMGLWRPSTARRVPCAAPPGFQIRCERSASRCAAGCTPGRSS
jgi:alpha/beta hydrolase fold